MNTKTLTKKDVGYNWVSVEDGHPEIGVDVEVKWENKPPVNSIDYVVSYPMLMWYKGYNHTHWRYKNKSK